MTGPRIKISIASLNGGRGRGGIGSMGSDGRWEIGMAGRGSGVRGTWGIFLLSLFLFLSF